MHLICIRESLQEDVKFVLPRFVTQPTDDTHPFELRCSVCFLKVVAIFAPAQVQQVAEMLSRRAGKDARAHIQQRISARAHTHRRMCGRAHTRTHTARC